MKRGRMEHTPGPPPPNPAKPKLDVVDFSGVVIAHEWLTMPDGRLYRGVRGQVTVMSAQEAVGFEPTGHNSANWLARVQGPTVSVNLMGCQVRAVLEGPPDALDAMGMQDIFRVP